MPTTANTFIRQPNVTKNSSQRQTLLPQLGKHRIQSRLTHRTHDGRALRRKQTLELLNVIGA